MSLPVIFHAPHRVMFLSGAVQVLAALAWWVRELAMREGIAVPIQWPIYAGWLHGLWLIYGVFPFFIFGFLMTAMPRWQAAPPVAPRVYLAAAALATAGWLLFWAGLRWPGLLPAALGLVMVGWSVAWKDLLRVAEHSLADRRTGRLLVAALAAGALGVGLMLVGVLGGGGRWLRGAIELGLWGFLTPVFVTVGHRMIPFFTSAVIVGYGVYRPAPALYLLVAASLSHVAMALAGLETWTWLGDMAGAAAAFHLSLRWFVRRSLAIPLLAMLHLAFLWLGVGFALFGLQGIARLAGREMLALAPLHALTLGLFGSMLLAMASRVTLGHAGRDLAADGLTVAAFLGVQLAAVLRIAADVAPPAASGFVLLAAGFAVLLSYAAWFLRYAPSYWRPRVDGRPG